MARGLTEDIEPESEDVSLQDLADLTYGTALFIQQDLNERITSIEKGVARILELLESKGTV
jgi:hypothetical protein